MSATAQFDLPPGDRDVLRGLAEQLAALAALPVQRERARLWTRLNDLHSARSMVWITEVPWHEVASEELRLRCRADWTRKLEQWMRREIYQARNWPVDSVVADYLPCWVDWQSTRFGIERVGEFMPVAVDGIMAQHYTPQISRMEDIAKIKDPVVTVDWAANKARLAMLQDAVGDIMPVRWQGAKGYWFTPWDNLVQWYGGQEAMIDLIDQPEVITAAIKRIVEAALKELDQLETLGLLTVNTDNTRVGSGAYGYTSQFPAENPPDAPGRAAHMWGCSNAQIFSEVSEEMHWEFALQHDWPWFERWGLNYYGCCEPLDSKMEIVRRIPRLRKISMNYRIQLDRAAKRVGDAYVFSYKPNPACFATDRWDLAKAREEVRRVIERTRGGHLEIVMKDISTVYYQPQRLSEWATMAMQEVEAAR